MYGSKVSAMLSLSSHFLWVLRVMITVKVIKNDTINTFGKGYAHAKLKESCKVLKILFCSFPFFWWLFMILIVNPATLKHLIFIHFDSDLTYKRTRAKFFNASFVIQACAHNCSLCITSAANGSLCFSCHYMNVS